jgi:hypothetical protein
VTAAGAELLAGLIVGVFVLLWIDLHFFARGREPSFREAVLWSIGWLVVSLLAAIPVWLLEGGNDAVVYTTVYLIERSLSLDNLFGCSTGASSPRSRCAGSSSWPAASCSSASTRCSMRSAPR